MEIRKAAQQVREALARAPGKAPPAAEPAGFLSSGSTLLNLALTGHPRRGFARGKYYLLVGDSASGKTFLSLTCLALLQTKKNRLTGKLYRVMTAIYPSYGIDDIGSCIDFLVAEGWWRRKGGNIQAKELGAALPREKLVRLFDGLQKAKVRQQAVAACWRAIDAEGDLRRGPRYV